MAVLLHWEPWRVTKELEREIDRLQRWDFGPWTDTFRRWVLPLTEEGRWVPACDLFARGDDLVVRIELPGIDPATDVQVSVQDGILCISGKRKYDAAMEQAEYYRRESAYGAFHRNIPLAQGSRPRTSRRATTTACSRSLSQRQPSSGSRCGSPCTLATARRP